MTAEALKTALAGEDCGSRQRQGWLTTAVVNGKGMQDWVGDYNGEGMTVGSDAGDSGVAMMAARVEDGGGRQQRRQRTTTVADDDGGG
jgi:hypothetical protein